MMRARDWLILVILSVLWGGTFFLAAVALKELPPLTLVLLRCAIGAAVLLALLAFMGLRLPRSAAGWRDFAVMAVLNNAIPFGLIFHGQQTIPSGLASVLNATTPLMSLIVLRLFAGEAMTTNRIAGVVLGLAGVAVLIGPDALGAGARADVLGMIACLGATLSYGLSGLWARRLKEIPAPVSAATQLLCSTMLMIPIAGVADRFWTLALPSTPVIAASIGLGVVSTALAYLLFFRLLASAGVLNAMLVTLLIPLPAIGLGALFLGEALSLRQLAGAAIIGLSLLIIDGRLLGLGRGAARA